MDYNTTTFLASARALRMNVVESEIIQGFILKFGGHNYYFFDAATPWNNSTSSLIASNKFVVNRILHEAQIPVANAEMIEAKDYKIDILIQKTKNMKFPLVVKPMLGTIRGSDVTCCIPNIDLLHQQCQTLFKTHHALQIEEYHGNLKDYRILIFKNKIIGVVELIPAFVVGNGKDTIATLVAIKNIKRKEISHFLKPIVFDFESTLCLENQHYTKDSIPPKDKKVNINYTCNLSRGGSYRVVSTNMCQENRKLFIKAAKVLNLKLVGFDIVCQSLDSPIINQNGIIIEANYNPNIVIHREGTDYSKNKIALLIMREFIYKHPLSYLCSLVFKS
ncbi:MAG: UDP-N-acetylmuramyl peptide synthase [Proteobacteria bacterium]|nr:UDP-N-acetylmuramyl peptide synthase [Pseudomonadota bacterium]